MKKSYLSLRLCMLGACVAALSACATQSGPTFSIREIDTPGQDVPAYRVTCNGMLSSHKACISAAQEFCKGKGATLLQSVDRLRDGTALKDPRELIFRCGTPQPKPVVQPAQPQPVPQQEPAPKRQVLLEGNANFATDSAVLTPAARQALDQFLAANRSIKFRRVTVTGFTDSTGSGAHNQSLSEARARSVATYLRTSGLFAQQFVSEGMGAADPVASNATVEGRARNRRVEIQVVPE